MAELAGIRPSKEARPLHGYVEKPEAGRWNFRAAAIIGSIAVAMPWLFWIVGGTDYVTGAFDSPIMAVSNPAYILMMFMFICFMPIVVWHSITVKGVWRTLAAMGVVYVVTGLAEGLGTNFGLVFGPYHYSNVWFFHVFGVPLVVPIAWETLMVPSFYLSLYIIPAEVFALAKSWWQKAIAYGLLASVGALFLTAIDLLLDPIAAGIGSWNWHVNGQYVDYMYGGEPIMNWIGWFFVGLAVMFSYRLILGGREAGKHIRSRYLDVYIPLTVYGAFFVALIEAQMIFQRQYDVATIAVLSCGLVLAVGGTKLFYEKLGSRPNPIGVGIAEQAIAAAVTPSEVKIAAPQAVE